MTEKPLAFLSLVKLLETAVGQRTRYTILDPFPCAVLQDGQPAIIAIQDAGKRIAQHIGIDNLTFIISVTKHDKDMAGHIELNREGSEVFVELSNDIFGYKDAVLATICHELCHKYLHVHGIRKGIDQIEQEYLTDVTAVYLGLGKIMLNGCECQSSYSRREGGKTVTTTHTLKTGYISRDCFAFVYRLICAMRGIPSDKFLMGLSSAAKDAISHCENIHWSWFNSEYRNPEEIERVAECLRETVLQCQDDSARRHRIMRRLEGTLRVAEANMYESHRPLGEAQRKISALTEPQPNPHLRFLACLETKESVAAHADISRSRISDAWNQFRQMEPLASSLQTSGNPETEILECPLDRTRLRVPSGRNRLLVTCPTCKYIFVANTASDSGIGSVKASRRRSSVLIKRLKSILSRTRESQSSQGKYPLNQKPR